jgi:histidinol-phosphatase
MAELSADLELALRLADAADATSLSFFRGLQLSVEEKADRSPVTEADRAVERELRQLLAEACPADGVLGEEYGAADKRPRRWILDPIDGTRNFARGIPVWGTLIALEERGELRLGVISAPALRRRWWAERGAGAYAEGEPISVSAVMEVESAVVSLALDRALPAIAFDAWHTRGYGDFWAHMLLAEGAIDGVIENVGVKEWDLAAVQVIVEEAGGRFSDFGGVARADRGTCVTSNGHLHDALLRAVAPRSLGR